MIAPGDTAAAKALAARGAGRPKGVVEQRWKKLSYWIKLVENEWPKLRPSQRANLAMDAFKALLKRARFTSDDEYKEAIDKAIALTTEAGNKKFESVT